MTVLEEIKQEQEIQLGRWFDENFSDKTINGVNYYSAKNIAGIMLAYDKEIKKMFNAFAFWENNIPSWQEIKSDLNTKLNGGLL